MTIRSAKIVTQMMDLKDEARIGREDYSFIIRIKVPQTDLIGTTRQIARIKFRNENELMKKAEDPEQYYIEVIMQEKIKLYLEYL